MYTHAGTILSRSLPIHSSLARLIRGVSSRAFMYTCRVG